MNNLIRMMCLLVTVTTLAACSPLVRTRTLPPSIRSVHVPMVVNRTAEPGVEEDLTVAIQEELLADGRLDVVREGQADATVKVTLTDWMRQGQYFDDDDYPVGQAYDIEAAVEVLENIPGHPSIGGRREVRSVVFFNADPRTTTFQPEPRAKDDAYRVLARQIVNEIITGEYADYSPTGDELPAESTHVRPSF